MAQTGFTPISIYYSSTASAVPTAGNLVAGELAINTADGRLYYKDSAGVVQVIGTKGGVGSSTTTQVLYNSSGLVVGSANLTFNGTTLTVANDASISGLTVGKGGGAVSTNTAIGSGAINGTGYSATTAVGYQALYVGGGGSETAVGYQALYSSQSSAGFNSALGFQSLYSNTTGLYNVAIGTSALRSNTTASNNTAVGYQAGYSNTTGNITVFGRQAMYYNTTGSDNTAMGNTALLNNTTGNSNSAFGTGALVSNTTASNNTAVGYQAGYTGTTATNLALFGYQAGYNNTANDTTAIGYATLLANTTGSANTALGSIALRFNTTGANNVAIGKEALQANTTASNNTAVGYQAGYSSTGGGNTFLGYTAGTSLTTGTQGVYVGYCDSSSGSVSNELVISGSGAVGKGANTGFISPNSGGVYQGNNSTLWSITSDQRLKKNIVDNKTGLDKITQIQIRNFEYRTADEVTELDPQNAIDIKGVQLGAIAQELQAILPDCVKTESTGVMSVDASNITWYLVNAIQELKAEIDQLKGVK